MLQDSLSLDQGRSKIHLQESPRRRERLFEQTEASGLKAREKYSLSARRRTYHRAFWGRKEDEISFPKDTLYMHNGATAPVFEKKNFLLILIQDTKGD